MHRRHLAVIWLLVLIVAAPGPVSAARKGRLVGRVVDSAGAPIEGVSVTATSAEVKGFTAAETTDTKGTFVVDLPNGTYRVSVRLGDAGKVPHDQMGLSLEGIAVDPVTTAARNLVWQTYTVQIGDGKLHLDLKDLGGTDKNVAIAALVVSQVAAVGLSGRPNAASTSTDASVVCADGSPRRHSSRR